MLQKFEPVLEIVIITHTVHVERDLKVSFSVPRS